MSKSPRPPIPIAKPHIDDADLKSIEKTLHSGWLTQGPRISEFETRFAKLHDVPHAIAATSCTTALHLILLGLGVGPGDEVLVPSFTWVATANAVLYCGAKPVLVDVDLESMNISAESVRSHLTDKTKAIIAVHLFGRCADMEALKRAAPGIPIVEDAACAVGSVYKEQPAGSLGVAGAFSFHPRKIITTGEGGMITTADDQLAKRIRMLRNHGAEIPEENRHAGNQPYLLPDFPVMGFNFRMTDLQGALGCSQLDKLDGLLEGRRTWANYYLKELKGVSWLALPEVPQDQEVSWQSFVCRIRRDEMKTPERDGLLARLHENGISSRPGTHAIHMLDFYKRTFGYKKEDYPNSLICARDTVALPLHSHMVQEDYDHVIDCLRSV